MKTLAVLGVIFLAIILWVLFSVAIEPLEGKAREIAQLVMITVFSASAGWSIYGWKKGQKHLVRESNGGAE